MLSCSHLVDAEFRIYQLSVSGNKKNLPKNVILSQKQKGQLSGFGIQFIRPLNL